MSQSPGMSHREHEAAILGTLRRELGETKYDRWLGNASASVQVGEQGQDPHSVVIEVDNAFAARWVETKFIPELRVACKGIRSEQTPPWRIRVRQDDTVESTDASTQPVMPTGLQAQRLRERLPHHSQPRRLPTPLGSQAADLPPISRRTAVTPDQWPPTGSLSTSSKGPATSWPTDPCVDCWKTPSMPPPCRHCSCTAIAASAKPTCCKARVGAGGFHPIQSHPVLLRGAIHQRIHSGRPRTRLGTLPTTTANSGPLGHR